MKSTHFGSVHQNYSNLKITHFVIFRGLKGQYHEMDQALFDTMHSSRPQQEPGMGFFNFSMGPPTDYEK